MSTRKIKDAKDLSTGELIYFRGHAKSTFMSDGRTVEDAMRPMVPITWSELKNMRNNSSLVAGTQYRITDYITTTIQENTTSAGHQFDIIVTALDESTLSEEAKAIQHDSDTYFNTANLSAWQLWYCLDNDDARFGWADTANGKGVIYRMIDEFNNDCPYDFKNILFLRDVFTDGEGLAPAQTEQETESKHCYTFGYEQEDGSIFDATIDATTMVVNIYENIIKAYFTYNGDKSVTQQYLNNIVFLSTYKSYQGNGEIICNSNSFGNNCYNNSFGDWCYNNSFGDWCFYNSFGNDCYNNSFGDSCYNNSFGDYCDSNSFKNYCSYNSFGDDCIYNSFGNSCNSNSFGNSCESNSFVDNCESNSFGDNCNSNSFGEGCSNNSFENNCESNSFGEGCSNNSFGDWYQNNSFGDSCYNNSFENNCINNSFGNDCHSNSFGNSCGNTSFGNNCSNNSFGDSCFANSFGNDCDYNSFRNNCHNNSFGNSCSRNSFGNKCFFNFFGDNCSGNSFGNDCKYNSFRVSAGTTSSLKSYCQYNHFDDGCSYNVIWNDGTTSSNFYLQNININRGVQGVQGTSNDYNFINVQTLNSNQEINITQDDNGIYTDEIVRIEYDKLKSLRDNSQLMRGATYRIIDYVTITSQENTTSAGHQFDIIVTALDESTLSEEAKAIQHDGDTYFTNSNLNKWQLWYCLDNDDTRFGWASDVIQVTKEISMHDSSQCTIQSNLVNENSFITPFNFESCVWVDGNGDGDDYDGADNHDSNELIYEWGYFTDENDNTQLCLYKSDAELYEEEGQPDYGDKYLYRGIITVDGTDYDYWQKWDEDYESINLTDSGDHVYATTPRIVSNPEAYTVTTQDKVEEFKSKGVIYRMIDEFNNDCPYDFKNILFLRDVFTNGNGLASTTGQETEIKPCYTFGYEQEDGSMLDITVNATIATTMVVNIYDNIIKAYFEINEENYTLKQCLNNIVFLNIYKYSQLEEIICNSNSFELMCNNNSFGNNCYNNSFGDMCNNNSFGGYCYDNSFENGCESNSFEDSCYENSFGNSCYDNSFGNDCARNSFGNGCYENSFGNYCHYNSFGNDCFNNSFGNYCGYNSFGDECSSNSFGNYCSSNSFEDECGSNSFEEYCSSISFGDCCYNNSFGPLCSSNSFEFGCHDNSFGESCHSNSFGDHCYNNSFGESCHSNSFGDHCIHNSFGDCCSNNSFGFGCHDNSFRINADPESDLKSYCKYNHFDDGCSYNVIWNSDTTSSNFTLQNINVNRGVSGTSNSYNTIHIDTLNVDYEIEIIKTSDGIYTYTITEADDNEVDSVWNKIINE